MKKLSKLYITVSLICFSCIFAVALMFYSNSKSVNVNAAENNSSNESDLQAALASCGHSGIYAVDEEGNQVLGSDGNPVDSSAALLKEGYFKFKITEYKEGDTNYSMYCGGNNEWTCVTISISKGSFKLLGEPYVVDYNGNRISYNFFNYSIYGGGNLLDASHPVVIRFDSTNSDFVNNIGSNVFYKFNFGLASDVKANNGNGCVGWDANEVLKANEGSENFSSLAASHPKSSVPVDGHDYLSFGVEEEIEITPATQQPLVHNPYYDTYCADLRTGVDNHFNSETFKKYYNKDYYNDYIAFLGNLCDKDVVGVQNEAAFKELLERLISVTWSNNNNSNESKYPIDTKFNDYKDKFEEYKNLAIQAGHSYNGDDVSSISKDGAAFNLKCNANPVAKSEFNSAFNSYVMDAETGLPSYNISANKEYYYASKTSTSAATVDVTYTSGATGTIDLGKCEQTCEEVVVVEYGPPIASTGGVCFEYQVQVTSKIQCTTKNNLKPFEPLPLCTPYPYCNNSSTFWSQAGPNDDFEKCIKNCDGGKYTDKCSESCYDKVYGVSNQDKLQKNSFNFNDVVASKTWAGDPLSFDGNYKWKCDSWGCRIYWDNEHTYGRYYSYGYQYDCLVGAGCPIGRHGHNPLGSGSIYGGYYWPVNGFKWHFATYSGGACGNVCSWNGCGWKSFMNEKERAEAERKVAEAYTNASGICAAKASCTEKTATFKISVKYEYFTNEELEKAKLDNRYIPKSTTTTLSFPLTANKEELVSSAGSNCSGPPSKLEYNPEHIILNYAGCYKNCGDDTLYHTRWSFPGGWENNKSGELSWEDKSGDSDWTVLPDKFCLPSSLVNTNEKFWWYYISNLPSDQIPSWAKFIDRVYKPDLSYSEDDAKNIDYNIKASASNFGYFGWNFKFSCFYSSYNQGVDIVPQTTFKTVDLVDLFPKYQAKKSPDEFNTPDEQLPFNWSGRAKQNNDVKGYLQSDPVSYGKYVQTKGAKIYSDDELEYHFHLTPSSMKSFDKEDYKLYKEGTTVNNQGVVSYVSTLIRTGTLKNATVRAPSQGVLGCNNIKDVEDGIFTGRCMSISDLTNSLN